MSQPTIEALAQALLPKDQPGSSFPPLTLMLIVCVMLYFGPLMIVRGGHGARDKSILARGREYTGTAALLVSALLILGGTVITVSALAFAFRFLR
jgi:hypothetical protein